jgi:hypothetical protein
VFSHRPRTVAWASVQECPLGEADGSCVRQGPALNVGVGRYASDGMRYALLTVLAALTVLIPVSAATGKMNGRPSAQVGPLTLTYPARFHRRDFASCDYRVTGVQGACVNGVVVANIQLGPNPELGASYPWLPRTVAKFELVLAAPQPGVVEPTPTYPLSLRSFRETCRGCGMIPKRLKRFSQVGFAFHANDANYWAIAWIGKRISRRDYRALKSIVASIHLS